MATKRSPKKKGKYAPLIWIVSGALIAFFITYSGNIKKTFVNEEGSNSQNISQAFEIRNIISNFSSSFKSESFSNSETESKTTYKVYLAQQKNNVIYLVDKPVSIPHTKSPIRDVLEALIKYQDEQLLNLVPIHTLIKNIWIKNDVLYIDFSEEFSYNSYGLTGYKIQIYQIVYTATQFPQVKAVYFYQNGKPLQYLGGDGYPIHNPIYPYSSLPKFNIT
jgi:spore germination protein GerM